MRTKINEGLPSMVPQFPVDIAGQNLTLRFDTNINKTKKGIKVQFVLKEVPQDPRQLQQLANQIGSELQTKFGDAGLQITYDVENPYKNVIGFLIPLPSVADYLLKNIIQLEAGGEEPAQEEVPAEEETPADEEAPADQEAAPEEEPKEKLPKEPMAERRHIKLIDLLR